jgi:metallo-beta-lactamase family protein
MKTPPKKIFVNHGEDTVTDFFADYLEKNLSVPAIAPYSGDEFDLTTGECSAKSVVRKVTKVSDGRRKANAAFDRLLAAGKRLLDVINVSRGLSNKELAKFTDQINSLCDKYLRK